MEDLFVKYGEKRRNEHSSNEGSDYERQTTDSFFKLIRLKKDYDRNEVPWEDDRSSKPVKVHMSSYLRNVYFAI